MRRIIISFLFLGLAGSFIADGIIIPKEIQSKVTPTKGAFYMDEPVMIEPDIYSYRYEINAYDLNIKSKTNVDLEIYNPETGEWTRANAGILTPDKIYKNTTIPFVINLKDRFNNPFLGYSKYRAVSNGSIISKEFKGPNVVVNFRNEGCKKVQEDKNLYDYFVEVRSTEPLLPISLYVTKNGKKWVKYGLPQTYNTANSWKFLVWHNVPYFEGIEFRAKIK